MTLAFVFPGQGSQSVGMLADLAATSGVVKDCFAEASGVLGYDLWHLTQEGPAEELNLTEKTQPAMLTAGVAVWRAWQDRGGPRPTLLAGHSLGEITALVCADSIGFRDGVELVRFRGEAMQAAVAQGDGGMAAIIGLDDARVEELCASIAEDQVLEAVNFNAPGQVVIAGHKAAIDRAVAAAPEFGARRAMALAVSVPAHSALMKPAGEKLRQKLAAMTVNETGIPVLNVDLEYHGGPDQIRDAVVRQLFSAVQWVRVIRTMLAAGADQIVECGPGKVLTGLNRRIEKNAADYAAIFDGGSLAAILETCKGASDA